MKRYFETLNLEENATYEEVRKARVKLLKKYHPDLHVGNPKYAKMKTEEINEAFSNLKVFFENNADKKQELDNINFSKIHNESEDKRKYVLENKEKALEKLNKKNKNKENRFAGKNLLDISIMVLFSIIIILFFVLIFA